MKLLIVLGVLLACLGAALLPPANQKPPPLPFAQTYRTTVLLIPLDSRPACTNFVTDLGKTASIRVLMPPPEILDHYRTAGDTEALRNWCLTNAKDADAAILSIDMLIHGGLLASRHANASTDDVESALAMLETLHEKAPTLPIYAFHILPRLWPADSEENNRYRKEILKYAKLVDEVYTFENPLDIKKQNELMEKIPTSILTNYHRVFEDNFTLNKKLIAMAQNGVLRKLVIGQDDGESFGVPNIAKRRLLHYLKQQELPSDKVFVTKGADEIALTLLAALHGQRESHTPKINVQYDDGQTAGLIMPYMATSIATTVKEKIAMLHGTLTENPDEADFILFVYVGSDRNVGYQYVTNQRIQSLLAQNYKVALVDLSQHFAPDETILPVLMRNSASINRLIAYSGWNTASNAIGIALSQGAVFTAALNTATTDTQRCTLYKNNLTFLSTRFLEDYFYLKESIDAINRSLKSENTDIYNFKDRYRWANTILKADMINKARYLENSFSYLKPLPIELQAGTIEAHITDLNFEVFYPWERTFEIEINAAINLEKKS